MAQRQPKPPLPNRIESNPKISFSNPSADLFIPDNAEPSQALGRTTHLGIGAHQDDLEVMALHGILACYQSDERWFGGVTVTNGSGSSRTNQYSDYTDEQMCAVRAEEQRKAAVVGEYAFMAQLDYPSSVVKQPGSPDFANDLQTIFCVAKPRVFTRITLRINMTPTWRWSCR